MTPFLKSVAESVYNRHKNNFETICLVFPNLRAQTYFNRYLSEIIEKPIWNSKSTTISSLVAERSKLNLVDQIQLIHNLYESYKKHVETQEGFEEFFSWGEMILSDFDQVDKYLINAEDLFENIENLREIDYYFENLGEDELRSFKEFWEKLNDYKGDKYQKNFVTTWKKLFKIYTSFREQLLTNSNAYEGMIYREVADNFDSEEWQEEKYIFVGFNALNASEIKIFDQLQDAEKAEFYWDFDDHYVQIPEHEAGFFIKEFVKRFPPVEDFSTNNFQNKEVKLEIVSVESSIKQTKILYQYLNDKNYSLDNKTAVLLADESLVVPIMNSMEEKRKQFNISMGYSIKYTNSYSFVMNYISLITSIKFIEQKLHFRASEVIQILSHPYVEIQGLENLSKHVADYGIVYLNLSDVFGFVDKKFHYLFDFKPSTIGFLDHFKSIVNSFILSEQGVESEFLYKIDTEINSLVKVLSKGLNLGTSLICSLLKKRINGLTVAFDSYNLDVVQVMGILESRLLDFENVVVLSLNESIFPKIKASPSFIPQSLRTIFKLPTIQHQDSIFAYYFYRALQRAKNISFIYNASADSGKAGEESRFIKQVEYETQFTTSRIYDKDSISFSASEEIGIEKDETYFHELEKFAFDRGMSASMLNTYIACPLKFYYKYIEKLKEDTSISDSLDFQFLGNLFHTTAEFIYNDLKNKLNLEVEIPILLKNKTYIKQKIKEAYSELKLNFELINSGTASGKISLIEKIVEKSIRQLLKIDSNLKTLEIVDLEYKFLKELEVSGIEKPVKILGFIDRVDKLDGEYRLIDYKTGSFELEYSSMNELFSKEKKNKKEIFQCLLYSLINNDSFPDSTPAIYGLKSFYSKNFATDIKQKKSDTIDMDEFKLYLEDCLREMFDPETKITQTPCMKNCEICEFAQICR